MEGSMKYIILFFSFLCIFSLTACGSNMGDKAEANPLEDISGESLEKGIESGVDIENSNPDNPESKSESKTELNENVTETNESKKDEKINQLAGVTMEIKENTLSNQGLTIVVNNKGEYDLTFGDYYYIEKEIDGNWHEVSYLEHEHEIGWHDIGYEVLANSSYEFEPTDWEWLYGILEEGKYRFVKDGIVGRGEDIVRYYFGVEFSLTK